MHSTVKRGSHEQEQKMTRYLAVEGTLKSIFQRSRFTTQYSVSMRAVLLPQGVNQTAVNKYEGWNFNSGNYLFTTDTK